MSVAITVVGTGYVGLVSGTCLAELDHDVICVDKDPGKIFALQGGKIPIYEPRLATLVARNVEAGRLRFDLDLAASVKDRDAVFIAVGTPSEEGTGQANLGHVFAAAEEIAAGLNRFGVVVTKSTVPVGTNRRLARILAEHKSAGVTAAVASNPEFLREGVAVEDFMRPDRIVVGAEDPRASALMSDIYAPLVRQGVSLQLTSLEAAELIKYAANAFLAVKISFINEIADLCESVGADVEEVAAGIGSDNRIGSAFLRPGPGWGGSRFPKDTRALDATARSLGVRLRIVEACIAANAARKGAMGERVAQACGGSLMYKRVALLGVTFKGQTDDMRESPVLEIAPLLREQGALVTAYDPASPPQARALLPNVVMASSPQAAVHGADAVVVMTDWREFLDYDLCELAGLMRDPVMVDLRNLFAAETALDAGFRLYCGVGRVRAEREHLEALMGSERSGLVSRPELIAASG